jgi:hypothetical protein
VPARGRKSSDRGAPDIRVKFQSGEYFRAFWIVWLLLGLGVGPAAIWYYYREVRARASSEAVWVITNTLEDWDGGDYAYTVGNMPKYNVREISLCDDSHVGQIAICWDNRPNGYPDERAITDFSPGEVLPAWCTYKNKSINILTRPDGSAPPGVIYLCGRPVKPFLTGKVQ